MAGKSTFVDTEQEVMLRNSSAASGDVSKLPQDRIDVKSKSATFKRDRNADPNNPKFLPTGEKKSLELALRSNTFKPSKLKSTLNGPGDGRTNTVPSKLIDAQQQAGTSRFDKSKLTLGNNPYTGQVGMFKDGEMLDSSKIRLSGGNLGGTPLPAGQQTSFVKNPVAQSMVQNLTTPQPQTGIPGVTAEPGAIPGAMPGGNWTGLMNAETAMLNAVVNPKLKPGQFQDFKGTIGMNPGQPGGDSAFRSIESQIADLTNQNKQLLGGYGQTTDMGRMSQGQRMAMVQKNSETIKALNESLTGRSTLANDLVKALIGAQSNQQVANTAAGADVAKAGIAGDATIQAAGIEAQGDVAAAGAKAGQSGRNNDRRLQLQAAQSKVTELGKLLKDNPGDQKLMSEFDQAMKLLSGFIMGDDDDLLGDL